MPATAAFWTSSKLARPETRTMRSFSGSSPARKRPPMSLSSALWRPTSSLTSSSSPAASKRPAAWMPPVAVNTSWAARNRPGSARSVSGVTTGPSGIGRQRTWTSSREALPQIPHDAVATKLRAAIRVASNGWAKRTMTSSSGWACVAGSATSIATMSAGSSSRPSVRRNPAASSDSLPGVRMVTATSTGAWPGPQTRMAMGSSPDRRSSRVSTRPARYAVMTARVARRSREGSAGWVVMGGCYRGYRDVSPESLGAHRRLPPADGADPCPGSWKTPPPRMSRSLTENNRMAAVGERARCLRAGERAPDAHYLAQSVTPRALAPGRSPARPAADNASSTSPAGSRPR